MIPVAVARLVEHNARQAEILARAAQKQREASSDRL